MRYLAHKIRIYPNKDTKAYFSKCFGVARFSYNWALDTANSHYKKTSKSISTYEIRKQLNHIKRDQFPWMMEVTKHAPMNAVLNSGKAFQNFFKKKSRFPKFHKKGFSDSFTITADGTNLRPESKHLRIPRWKSSVRMAEEVRFQGRILSITISKRADQYFASFQVEISEPYKYPHCSENQAVVGIDLGISSFTVLSIGEKVQGPKALRIHEMKLKRLQRSLSNKKKGSANRRKARLRLARYHLKIHNIRQDFLHKLSTDLVKRFGIIVIEDLAVSSMVKNHCLAKSIMDQSWGEFRRQLEYKIDLANQELKVADRYYASSKLCSTCGFKNDNLKLSDRTWTCANCDTVHDRDINAARNLAQLAMDSMESINACGGL